MPLPNTPSANIEPMTSQPQLLGAGGGPDRTQRGDRRRRRSDDHLDRRQGRRPEAVVLPVMKRLM